MPQNDSSRPPWLASVPAHSGTYPYPLDPKDPYRYIATVTSIQRDAAGRPIPRTIHIHILNTSIDSIRDQQMAVAPNGVASLGGKPIDADGQAKFSAGLPRMKALLASAEAAYNRKHGAEAGTHDGKTKPNEASVPKTGKTDNSADESKTEPLVIKAPPEASKSVSVAGPNPADTTEGHYEDEMHGREHIKRWVGPTPVTNEKGEVLSPPEADHKQTPAVHSGKHRKSERHFGKHEHSRLQGKKPTPPNRSQRILNHNITPHAAPVPAAPTATTAPAPVHSRGLETSSPADSKLKPPPPNLDPIGDAKTLYDKAQQLIKTFNTPAKP